jgi:uncharacterized protein (TIGR03435 family)
MTHPIATMILGAAVFAAAQTPDNNARTFEVATVKVAPPLAGDRIYINLGHIEHGTMTLSNASLSDCLRFAYGLTSDSQLAGPDWIKSKEFRYMIVAKTAPETPREDALQMLQSLLTERFQLTIHREPREMSYYALLPGKNASKLKPGTDGDADFSPSPLSRIAQPRLSMLMLATLISRFELHSTVLDMTGIPGTYDIKLEWSPANAKPANANVDAPPGPSIFTAVQEQLGLKLEARKGPIEVLVIDHAEKVPTEN